MNPGLIAKLRSDLTDARYSLSSLTTLWGRTAEDARGRGVFIPAMRVLEQREESALATLGAVFLLGAAVPRDRLDAALPSLGAAGAEALGLVASAPAGTPAPGGDLSARLALNPVELPGVELPGVELPGVELPGVELPAVELPAGGGAPAIEWWIISDLDDELRGGPARPDHVMGVGGATRSLIAQVPPIRVGRALDLGTGCGIVAMYLTHLGAAETVASDISERALELAAANAALNGFEGRIEFRLGSLFEPFAGELFDLIVSNPPFVITPRGDDESERYDYRDGGMTGDELAATVVRTAPQHLAEGGSLVCLANWETEWGGHGLERVRGWVRDAATLGGSPLDAWVIERDRVDTVRYAETWARDGGSRPGQPAYDALIEAWLEDFGARRIVSVGLGSIHVRLAAAGAGLSAVSAADASVIHAEQAGGALAHDGLGTSLRRALDAGSAAERASDESVLATRWVRAAAVSEERIYTPGEESPTAITLVTDAPIARRVAADTLLAAAIGACDGELTLGQIAGALATLLEVDTDAAAEALVAGARELAWLGMLEPAAGDDAAGDDAAGSASR